MKYNPIFTAVVFGFTGLLAWAADNKEWPEFRGPDRDGISKDAAWDPVALASGPKVMWTTEVGAGYSSVAVYGDRVFTAGNKNNQDTLYALALKSGEVLWSHSYPCQGGSYPGPRATPATDGDWVYMLSRDGRLLCLDAKSGVVKWEKPLTQEFGSKNLTWGFSGSPIIKGELLLVNAGESGLVLNRKTGAKIWASPAGMGGYAAPVLFKDGKEDRLAIFGSKALHIVDLETGKKRAQFPWATSYDVNAADPIIHDGKIFISSGYGKGCSLVDISGSAPRQIWGGTVMRNHFSSCILIDGFLYGFDGQAGNGTLKCVEFMTGVEKWSERIGHGALSAVNDHLVALNDGGDLFIIKASPSGYNLVASAKKVLEKTCWTAPIMCHGIIFARNDKGHLVAIDVSKK